MTDREAFLNALGILENIAHVAGGFVSTSQRAKIEELAELAKPYRLQAMLDAGWTPLPNGSFEKREPA